MLTTAKSVMFAPLGIGQVCCPNYRHAKNGPDRAQDKKAEAIVRLTTGRIRGGSVWKRDGTFRQRRTAASMRRFALINGRG
ncbi:hypothetical protein LAB1_19370 [Roseibium sp. LAB1]